MTALEDFLETLREQPAKEMNDRCNKWIMFVERKKNKGTEKSNDYSGKQGPMAETPWPYRDPQTWKDMGA